MAYNAGFSVPWLKRSYIHFAASDSELYRSGRAPFLHGYLINFFPIYSRVTLPENLRDRLPFGSEPL